MNKRHSVAVLQYRASSGDVDASALLFSIVWIVGLTMAIILTQIAVLDVVFSLDSVITAVGLVQHVSIMAIAIIAAIGVMLFAAKPISNFVDAHPTIKMLALSFLILVGVTLIVEGFDVHVPKGYIYFSMAFSVAVEMLNLRLRKKQQPKPVKLYKTILN
jgi:predicted tellurium resistance membrane protein TerC